MDWKKRWMRKESLKGKFIFSHAILIWNETNSKKTYCSNNKNWQEIKEFKWEETKGSI